MTNSGLDLDLYLNGKTSPVASGSDSGISDQSPKADKERSRHESSAYASSNEDEAMLQVHRVEDGTLVIGSSPARYLLLIRQILLTTGTFATNKILNNLCSGILGPNLEYFEPKLEENKPFEFLKKNVSFVFYRPLTLLLFY